MPDPTCPAECGTDALRTSKDAYNAALTFSVVYRCRLLGQVTGLQSLDLECRDEEEYITLLRGFTLLKQSKDEAAREGLTEAQGTADTPVFARRSIKRAEALWTSGPDAALKQQHRHPSASHDPITKLFEPSVLFDPWRLVGSRVANKPSPHLLPPTRFLGWTTPGTQVWARLHMAGLEVRCVFGWDLATVLLKVRCPEWRLEEMAERLHLKLRKRD